MKKYIGVKQISAEPMTKFEFSKFKGHDWDLSKDGTEKGYKVKYEDGFISWSPKNVFEKAYRSVSGFSFGFGIELMKIGYKIARRGWNGKGMYICIIEPGNAMHHGYDMQPCIGMKTADNKMQPGWLPSQADILVDDYVIVE